MQNPYQQIGYSGTINSGGIIDSGEWANAWQGNTKYRTVKEMRTDAIISSIENAYSAPLRKGEWLFYYENEKLNQDQKHIEILEFVKQNFSQINKSAFLYSAFQAVPNGVYLFEKVYEYISRKIMLKKLAPRLPETIQNWTATPHGELYQVTQNVYIPSGKKNWGGAYREIDIDAKKLLVITHKKEGDNFEGYPEYRNIYREWYIKDLSLRKSIVTIDRVGTGIPYARMKDEAGETVTKKVGEVMKKLKSSENAYAVFDAVDEVGMLSIDPNALEKIFESVIKYCDESLAKSMSQMVIALGTSNTGSRALGDTFADFAYNGIEMIADEICSAINEQLIVEMVNYNFSDVQEYPKLMISIERNKTDMLNLVNAFKQSGLIIGNSDIENVVLTKAGLPETNAKNKLQNITVQIPETQMNDCGCGKKHIQMSDSSNDWQIFRAPTEKENACGIQFADVANGLNAAKIMLSKEIRKAVELEIRKMAGDVEQGKKIYQINPVWGNKIKDIYIKYYKKIYEQAADDVRKELKSQDKEKKLSERLMMADSGQSEYEKWAREQAEIEGEILSADTKKAFLQYYKTGIQQGLSGKALSDFIMSSFIDEVGQRYNSAANRIVGGYAYAREVTAEELSDQISSKIRTEIFDNNICAYCVDQDGAEYILTDGEYIGAFGDPAPDLGDAGANPCEGNVNGRSCRGMYIYTLG